MKHSIKVTLVLLIMFFLTQLIGIYVAGNYSPKTTLVDNGNGTLVNSTSYGLPYGMDPPKNNDPKGNLISIIISIAFAITIMLILMRVKAEMFLRGWFFLVVAFAISITLNSLSFFKFPYSGWIIFGIGLILASLKMFRRNVFVHNITELLIYPGIAALFIPLLNIWTVCILLVFISLYDIYAVWHAGFMQKMAKYQMQKLKVFSGFFIPYLSKDQKNSIEKAKEKGLKDKKMKVNVAILGGGDVVFPIILSGVILHSWGIIPALVISLGATFALGLLFYYSEKGKFYPAMPFITAGCFVALAVAAIFA